MTMEGVKFDARPEPAKFTGKTESSSWVQIVKYWLQKYLLLI